VEKILCITNDFGPRAGGIETFVIGLIERLPFGSVIVYTSAQEESAPYDLKWLQDFGVEVVRDKSKILLPTPGVAYCVHALVRERKITTVFFGAAAQAAKTAGISVPFVITSTMMICGALAGLGGAVQVLGTEYALNADIAGSFGFDAITVALLGRAQPLGTVFAALLFGALQAGGRTMQSNTGVPLDIVLVTQALIVLFIAAPAFVRYIFRVKKMNSSAALTSKGWNG
jgi:ribose/xylose/arabinose/galactoside ABC-type transport system permease subunit